MTDIAKLIRKKKLTGKELGILELEDVAVRFNQTRKREPVTGVVSRDRIGEMFSLIEGDIDQVKDYFGYRQIQTWLTTKYNIGQTYYERVCCNLQIINSYIKQASIAEDVFSYIAQLPVIVTEKQINDLRAEKRASFLKDHQKHYTPFDMILSCIQYYVKLRVTHPTKYNILNSIAQKYESDHVKSEYIRSKWGLLFPTVYYILEDGSKVADVNRSIDDSGFNFPFGMLTDKFISIIAKGEESEIKSKFDPIRKEASIEAKKVLHNGGSDLDAKNAFMDVMIRYGMLHPYKGIEISHDMPDNISKWDVISCGSLSDLYSNGSACDGCTDSEEERAACKYRAAVLDFSEEFSDLISLAVADLDKKYTHGDIARIPAESWLDLTFRFDVDGLYDIDFYGMRENVESDINVFGESKRSLYNGIAILRPNNMFDQSENLSARIDGRGYYKEPDQLTSFKEYALDGFFQDYPGSEERVEDVASSLKCITDYILAIKGFQVALNLISNHYGIPSLDVYIPFIEDLKDQIDEYNNSVITLYNRIYKTEYQDDQLKEKKLDVLRNNFKQICYNDINVPQAKVKRAKSLLSDFRPFNGTVTESQFFDTLFVTRK